MKYKAIVEVKYNVFATNLLGITERIATFDDIKDAIAYRNTLDKLGLCKVFVGHDVVSITNLENIKEESAE